MRAIGTQFFHLNREGAWPDFRWTGLLRHDDGALTLAPLPRIHAGAPIDLSHLGTPNGPAGVTTTPDGTLYWTDPHGHRIWRRDGCDGLVSPVPCLAGPGSGPAELREPRGLAFLAARNALVVADTGNHRLLLVSVETLDVAEIWGGSGQFDRPGAVAVDDAGHVYVTDTGNHRVQKLDPFGRADPHFWQESPGKHPEWRPADVAVGPRGSVYVLDRLRNEILVLEPDGSERGTLGLPKPDHAQGLLVDAAAIHVGINGAQQLISTELTGRLLGAARGYTGPVAGLAKDGDTLWASTGTAEPPVRFDRSGAHATRGTLVGGPFGPGDLIEEDGQMVLRDVLWHRLKTEGDPVPEGAHLQLFVALTNDVASEPEAPLPDASVWHPLPADVADALVWRESPYIWIGAEWSSDDGTASPRVTGMRLHYDHEGYGKFLPAVYYGKSKEPADKAEDAERLDRWLALFESFYNDTEEAISGIDRLFDVAAVPAEWLEWLAGWLAVELDEDWPEARQREAIAGAMAASAWRGTARGLRDALHRELGVDAHIEEPIRHAGWWALPRDESDDTPAAAASVLGFTTMLPGAEAQGAVLGNALTPQCDSDEKTAKTTARLDASHLILAQEFGRPLFDEVAHRFSVEIYEAQVPCGLDEVHALVEREKPAHTAYRLCVIRPRLRVGFQARIGIDSVVAGGRPLGDPGHSGPVLAGSTPGRVGKGELGRTTRLGESAIETKGNP